MDIFNKIKKLNLQQNQFVVLGSGILAAKNIRSTNDIDLLVSPELFDSLKNSGWKYEVISIDGNDRERISFDIFEAYKDFWNGETLHDYITNKGWIEVIEGINFWSLEKLTEIKQIWKREKDLMDLELINQWLIKKGRP